MWMRSFWNNHIDRIWNHPNKFHQIRGQTYWMFHLKTSNLHVIHATNTKTKPSVSIHSMHFVFPFCLMDSGRVIIIPISKKSWETEATLLSDFSSFLPLRVSSYKDEFRRREIPWDFYNTKFTMGNLIQRFNSSLIDRGFAEFIFPNLTVIDREDDTCLCCKLNLTTSYDSLNGSIEYFNTSDHSLSIVPYYYEAPQLRMNERFFSILLSTGKDEFTFLSCGDPTYDPPDFLALFMPFSKTTWALIFMTIFGWPLVLSLIENDFRLKNVLKDFDALFIGWAMILEQSHLRATNYKGRGPLYCYCGCVLLAILVLSNAYKGDNIQALTKTFNLAPLTHINHVINAGYKKFSSRLCITTEPQFYCKEDEFYYVAEYSKHQYSDKQYKKWEPLHYVDINDTEDDEFKRRFEWFGECREKKALLGWRGKNDLAELAMKLRRKHKSAHISLGEEFIFSRRKGWLLDRYGSIKFLKRMWTLVESGVYNELLNISYKTPIAKPSEPRKLAIHGNIFVQFVLLSGGLLLAFLIFIAEFHKNIIRGFCSVRDSVRFLISNFLQHCQEAFLLGLKQFLNMWVKLLNLEPLLLFCNSCRTKTKRPIGGKAKLYVPQQSRESSTLTP